MLNQTMLDIQISGLPFEIKMYSGEFHEMNIHKELRIVYVIKGHIKSIVSNTRVDAYDDSLLIFNSFEHHEIISNDPNSLAISYKLDPTYFNTYYPGLSNEYFESKTRESYSQKHEFFEIKREMASIVLEIYSKNEGYMLSSLEFSIRIIKNLMKGFKTTGIAVKPRSDSQSSDRLIRILDYIDRNFDKKLSLAEVAGSEYISIHYLSKFFKENMGIGFNDYIHQVRLQKSMNELMNSNKSILEVAINNGFPNAKSYTHVFKKTYGVTPHAFRKNNDTIVDKGLISDQNFSGDSINLLKEFIIRYNSQNISHDLPQVVSADIDLSKNKHDQINFNKIIYFDFVYDGLNSNWQNNLSKIQNELKFSYIKFRGIFTKGMYFYDTQDNWYNWFNVDNLLDFFISIGLKPFIELTYKPSEHTLNAWYEILESFLNHCLKRYGLEELKSWNFEIASEDRRYESSIKLYTKTLKRLRVKFRDLRLGILFIPADDFEERDYLINFRDKDLKFMSVQLDESIYQKKTELCHQLFYNIRVGMGLETYFMKINSNTEYNDTCARASKFIANTLQINKVGVQVPFIDNIRNKRIFNGSSGLVTYNGLKKPLYNAYYMMNKISGKLIDSDKNYIVVKNNDTYMILIYNYIEQEFEISDSLENFIEIYNARIQDNQKYKINLHLNLSAEEGNYELRRYHLSPKYGSIFDAWLRMGAPYNLRKGDMDIIKSKEKMDLNIRNQYVKSIMKLNETIEPDEVILYEVRKL